MKLSDALWTVYDIKDIKDSGCNKVFIVLNKEEVPRWTKDITAEKLSSCIADTFSKAELIQSSSSNLG